MPLLSTLRWRTGEAPWQASWLAVLFANLSVPVFEVDPFAEIDSFTVTSPKLKSAGSQPLGRSLMPFVPWLVSATTLSTCTSVLDEALLIVNLMAVEPPG